MAKLRRRACHGDTHPYAYAYTDTYGHDHSDWHAHGDGDGASPTPTAALSVVATPLPIATALPAGGGSYFDPSEPNLWVTLLLFAGALGSVGVVILLWQRRPPSGW